MAFYQISSVPEFKETKGSLFLKSNHMNYGRGTLNSNWHQGRESEPKDYDINRSDERNLCNATYKRLATVTDGTIGTTTYQDFGKDPELKPDFTEKDPTPQMVDAHNVNSVVEERDLGLPKQGFGSALPRHHADHNKAHFETTYGADYNDDEFTPQAPVNPAEQTVDVSPALRKCHSQFTDTADFRRPGWNTWQDESGTYANSHLKRQVFCRAKPIPDQLQ